MFKDREKLSIIFRESFYFFSFLIFVFFILELLWPNFILAYFNLNYLVVIWLFAGLISLIRK